MTQKQQRRFWRGPSCAQRGSRGVDGNLAGKLRAPIVHALRGKEFIEYDNPFDVGMTGLLGSSSGYHAMMNCDTLLMLGTDFPYQQFYPKGATVIQIDIRGERRLARRTKVGPWAGWRRVNVAACRAEPQSCAPRRMMPHLGNSLKHYAEARKDLDELASDKSKEKGIHPQFITKVLDELAAEDAVFTCDVGTPTIWASRYLRMNGKRRLVGSFAHGSMANALPQAIGAQVSHPRRQVISLSGDGGLAMLMGDLLSLIQLKLPVKIIVFNNSSLAFVELEMKAAGILEFGTDLKNPNFAKVAEAAGILGLRAETPKQVRPMIERALKHDGPVLLEAMVSRQELSMPPSITLDQVKGFGLFMIKAVLSGRGSEIIDLAKVNLGR